MKIVIKEIPHNKQRYNTSGDYWLDKKGDVQVRISKMIKPEYFWPVLIHELVEMCLTKYQGVKWDKIDKFDKMVAKKRGLDVDPGAEKDAPYYKQHHVAQIVEELIVHELGINWEHYYENSVGEINKK